MMTREASVPASENRAWGSFGTISHHADADTVWPLAMPAVADGTGGTPDEMRNSPVLMPLGNPTLIKLLARAFRWRRMLETGAAATVTETAAREMTLPGFTGSFLVEWEAQSACYKHLR